MGLGMDAPVRIFVRSPPRHSGRALIWLAPQDGMLCDKCQIREASIHYTICTSPAVEEPKHMDLCQECFEASGLEGAAELPAVLQAGCRFCGGEAYGGGFDSMALLGVVRKMSFMCKPCSDE